MKKKIIIPVSIVCGIALITLVVFIVTKVNNSKVVANVISVGNISEGYFGGFYEGSSEGRITADLSQNIYLRDQLVKEVYVSQGDTVDIGDPLLEYDSTLLELDVEVKAIEIDTIDLRIKAANQELSDLKKQIAIVDSMIITNKRMLMTASLPEPDTSGEPDTTAPVKEPDTTTPVEKQPLERLGYDVELKADDNGKYELLCSEDTIITKAFINRIRGYDAEGINVQGDAIDVTLIVLTVEGEMSFSIKLYGATMEAPSEEGRDTSLTEYMANGKRLSDREPETTEDPGFGWEDPGDGGSGYTKDELNKLIAEKNQEIAKLELDKKQAQLDYENAKRKLDSTIVKSTVKGIVTTVGNPEEGAATDGSPFLVVDSQEGLYLTGTVNELTMDHVAVDDMITLNSWMTGMSYTAVITEISEFPADGQYYDANPNATHYPFTAYIEETQGLANDEYVSVSFSSESDIDNSDSIYINKAFVRQEQGIYYVLKENENGRLVKQVVQTGAVYYDYLIEIKSGLTLEDKITFPYGKTAKEGVRTQEATDMDVFY